MKGPHTGEITTIDAQPEQKLAAAVIMTAMWDMQHGQSRERGTAVEFLLSDRALFWYDVVAKTYDPKQIQEMVWDTVIERMNHDN